MLGTVGVHRSQHGGLGEGEIDLTEGQVKLGLVSHVVNTMVVPT